jgi:GGDEF domain-containing protein
MATPDLKSMTDEQLEAALAEARAREAAPSAPISGRPDLSSMTDEQLAAAIASTPEDLGFFAGIREGFTGTRRATPESQELPGYQMLPELNEMSLARAKAAFGTVMGDQKEMAQVIAAQFPNVSVRQDEKGNPILRSGIDGQEYVIAPGFDPATDIMRGVAATAMFIPANLRKRGLVATTALNVGTQALYETGQSLLGGRFGVADTALAGAGPVAERGVSLAFKAILPTLIKTFPRLFSPTTPPADVIVAPNLSNDEMVDLTARAARGDRQAQEVLATQVAPDASTLAAANRLGITGHLQPDHLTTSQVYRELAQLAKSQPGSSARSQEMAGLQQVGQRAFDIIEELGGTADLSSLNASTRAAMQDTLADTDKLVDSAWTSLRASIGETTPITANNTLSYIQDKIVKFGGGDEGKRALSPLERRLLDFLSPKDIVGRIGGSRIVVGKKDPTYALFDSLRRDVGNATRGRGLYKDEDQGLASQLYKMMVLDTDTIAANAGADAVTQLGITRSAGALQKSMQDDLVALFGRDVDRSMVNTLTSAVGGLSRGDADSFIRLINSVPPALRERVAVSGITSAFGRSTQNGQMNFNTYVNFYEGLLRNRTAYRTLMSNLPAGSRKQLSDLYRVARGINLSTQQFQRTGKALIGALDPADTVMGRLYGVVQRAAIGVPIEAGTAAVGFPGMGVATSIVSALTPRAAKTSAQKAADDLITSPAFVNMVNSAGTAQEQAARRAMLNNSAFRRFTSAINLPPDNVDAFLTTLFQPVIQAADEVPDEAPPPPAAVPPQAFVQPSTVRTRGVPAMSQPAGPAVASQGAPDPRAREMLQQLYPMDDTLRLA